MGVRNQLSLFVTFAKEGFEKSLLVGKFFCCLHVVNTYVCTPALAYGPSMLPTINLTGDLVLAERISTRFNKVCPGDVVLVRSPVVPRRIVTKRVIGMEGDRVSYVADPKSSDKFETVVVPKGHVWIEGDNIYESNDSRKFGAVPYGLIEGRVFFRDLFQTVLSDIEVLNHWGIIFAQELKHLRLDFLNSLWRPRQK